MRTLVVPPAPAVVIPQRHRQLATRLAPAMTTWKTKGPGFPSLTLFGGRDRSDDEPVVVILGATGTGKSKLSIDIGTAFPSEVVNSDKIQLYKGLDVTTNKMPVADRRGVPHHLLGDLDGSLGEMTPAGFRSVASKTIAAIRSRRRLPVIAGGSNSFVHALLAGQHEDGRDPFAETAVLTEGDRCLNYRSCLLWVDVEWDVLAEYLDKRVQEMVDAGMLEELERNYHPERAEKREYTGIDKAIGVPEFDKFFMRFPPTKVGGKRTWRKGEREAMEEAVWEVKANNRALAKRQTEKIVKMKREMGWPIRRLDATEAVRRKVEGRAKEEVEEAWERDVRRAAVEEVARLVGGQELRGGKRRLGLDSCSLGELAGRV